MYGAILKRALLVLVFAMALPASALADELLQRATQLMRQDQAKADSTLSLWRE